MLGKREGGGAPRAERGGDEGGQRAPAQRPAAAAGGASKVAEGEFDDDIPF
ncbi:hypothetical protein D3C83_154400 [compost metagenome]